MHTSAPIVVLCALVGSACSKSDTPAVPPVDAPMSAVDAPTTPMRGEADETALPPAETSLHARLDASVQSAWDAVETIPGERKDALDKLAGWVSDKRAANETASLVFICTHNSRRSHMGQLWAATAAAYFGVDGVETFSGGTEATAFNPRAVAALSRAGFEIAEPESVDNPRYEISYSADAPTSTAWSKTYDDASNPTEAFAAVMTCSDADRACPFVRGAEFRIAVPYDDPKAADGTPQEAERYDERSAQIAAEMLYVFSRVALPPG